MPESTPDAPPPAWPFGVGIVILLHGTNTSDVTGIPQNRLHMAERNKQRTQSKSPAHVSSEPVSAATTTFFSTGVAALVYFGLALLYFLPAFLPNRHIFGTDYLSAGYFFHEFASARFAAGALPKWVPYVFGGLPMFANPGSTFFPVRLAADVFLPVKDLFPAMYVVQFFLAGLGMYLLVRELGVRPWIAFVAGLAFQFTGLPMSFVYAGHDGRIIVATLAPLYLFFLHRGVRTGHLAAFAGATATLALALLSFQIQLAYYLLFAAAAWVVFAFIHLGTWRDGRGLTKRLGLGLGSVAFAFALATVNFLPFKDYVAQSPRGGASGRGYAYSTSYSMPPAEILGLAVPEQSGIDITDLQGKPKFPPYRGKSPFKLHTEYAGAFVVALLFLGVVYSRRDRYWWFFAGLSIVVLSVAFGGFTPLFRLYYAVMPEFKRFRAPNLTFFLVSTSLVTMAALTMERLAVLRAATAARKKGAKDPLAVAPWVLGGLIVLTIIGAGLAGGSATAGPSRAAGWMRFALFLAAVAVLLWLWLTQRLRPRVAAALLSLVVVTDLWIIDRRFFMTVPPPDVTFAADDVVRFLESQPGTFRVWAPNLGQQQRGASYRQGDYLMRFRIQQAGGEHGNQLQRWNQYVGTNSATYVDWHNFARYPVFMDAANVRYIITRAQLGGVPWKEVHRGSAGIVYENQNALPRAYLVGAVTVAAPPEGALDTMKQAGFDPRRTGVLYQPLADSLGGDPVQGTAEVTTYQPDHVEIHARTDRRALLVLADNYYEGWQATVDGQTQAVLRVDHTFRGVVLGPGDHDIVMDFRPASFYAGFWIYLVGSLVLLGYGLALLIRFWLGRRREAPAPA